MLLSMVIISGIFMAINLITAGFRAAERSDAVIGATVQALAWAFFFVVNLIALVK